jgi:hypothetical protein
MVLVLDRSPVQPELRLAVDVLDRALCDLERRIGRRMLWPGGAGVSTMASIRPPPSQACREAAGGFVIDGLDEGQQVRVVRGELGQQTAVLVPNGP